MSDSMAPMKDCPTCDGSGLGLCKVCRGFDDDGCSVCMVSSYRDDYLPCDPCEGSGRVRVPEWELEVADQTRMRLW